MPAHHPGGWVLFSYLLDIQKSLLLVRAAVMLIRQMCLLGTFCALPSSLQAELGLDECPLADGCVLEAPSDTVT